MAKSKGKKQAKIDEFVVVMSTALFGEGQSRYYINGELYVETNGNHDYQKGYVAAFRLFWDKALTLTIISIEDEHGEDCSPLIQKHKTHKLDKLMRNVVKHQNFVIETSEEE